MPTSATTGIPSNATPRRPATSARRDALFAILACAAVALILSARFWLNGAIGIFNADGLLPVAFVHDLQTHFATIRQFQLPRIPSLFPDLTVYTLLASIVADYRWALFGATVVQVAAFLIPATFVISGATQRPVPTCALSLCLLAGAAIALNEAAGGIQYFYRMFAIFEHFGPLCMSLVSLLIVLRLLSRKSRTLWLLLCATEILAITSNMIYAIIFVGPCLAALLLEYRGNRLSLATVLRFAACAAVAAVVASQLRRGLELQPRPEISDVAHHLSTFAADIARLFVEKPAASTVLLLAPLMHLLLFRWLRPSLMRIQSMRIVWTVACLAAIGAAMLCGLFYGDYGSLRYMTATVFWPLVFLAASLASWVSTSRHLFRGLTVVTAVYFAVLTGSAASAASTFRGWRLPLADCLMANKDKLGLRDGLAYYWLARPAVISSGWSLQIEQMMGGRYFHWGNNPYWSTHSMFDASRPPQFNYILPGTQNPSDIVQNFGRPSRVERCDDDEIWIYDGGTLELK